jgi:hypothetical protein
VIVCFVDINGRWSTKQTTTSHIHSLNTKITTYNVGNPGHGFGQAHKCDGVKTVNGIRSPTAIHI